MIEDFRTTIPDGGELSFDICIAGAGAAGITLALALADSGLRVGVFEGGGLQPPDEAGRDPYEGSVGPKPYPLAASRLRYLGGSTNHWGGWCRPLDPIDFEARDAIPLSGWPVTLDELAPFYRRAHEICEIGHREYDPLAALADEPDAILELPTETGFVNKLFRFSPPTRFGQAYRDDLRQASNVTVFLHANVTNVATRNGRVTHFDLRTLEGDRARAVGGNFVVALGGIENPRLLLNSTDEFESGLGNHADFLGRCFMDHFGFQPAHALTRAQLTYYRRNSPSGSLMPVLSMSDAALRERGLRNFCIQLQPTSVSGSYPPQALANPGFALAAQREDHAPVRYLLQFINEPTPNRESRVRITGERDALGMRRVHLDWRFNRDDLENVDRVVDRLATALGASGRGRLQHSREMGEDTMLNLSGGLHHMGTTRMSETPERGVVDAECRVHGIGNLYVAGSSVFPTVGFSNPTLTIVALALRLARHLRSGTGGSAS